MVIQAPLNFAIWITTSKKFFSTATRSWPATAGLAVHIIVINLLATITPTHHACPAVAFRFVAKADDRLPHHIQLSASAACQRDCAAPPQGCQSDAALLIDPS